MQDSSRSYIDVFQMTALLFLTRVFTLLTFTAGGGNKISGFDDMIVLTLSFILSMILFIPLYFLFKYFPGQDIVDSTASAFSPTVSKAAAVIYWAFCIFKASEALSGFSFFLSTAIYPSNPEILIVITFSLVCLYTVRKGIEPLARVSIYIFFISMFSYLFITGSLAMNVELVNFEVPFSQGFLKTSQSVIQSQGVRADIVLFLIFLPYLKGSATKVYVGMSTLILAVFLIMTFVTVGALGEYLDTQMFPYYSAASIAEMGFFQRLDSLHMAIWVMVSFVRVSLFLFAATVCLNKLLSPKKRTEKKSAGTAYINTVIMVLLSFVFSRSFDILSAVMSFSVMVIPFLLLTAVLPLAVSIRGYFITKNKGDRISANGD